MSTLSKPGPYHHGDLRRALIDAAMQLAEERGINGFTLREVARHAGVSHAAPYHHFVDKSALVEALVIESYKRFAEALKNAFVTTPGNSVDKLIMVGIAYVHFAIEQSTSFRFMFRPELRQHSDSLGVTPTRPSDEVESAGIDAFNVLIEAIKVCQTDGFVAPGDPNPIALTAWSAMHGLATLIIDGGLQKLPMFFSSDPQQLALMVGQIVGVGVLAR